MKATIIILLLSIGLLLSCQKTEINIIPDPGSNTTINLRVKNTASTINPIENLTILLLKDGLVTTVYQYEEVVFDQNNEFRTAISVPLQTTSITVLGNSIGKTSPISTEFVGKSTSDIFFFSTGYSTISGNYFNPPSEIYSGSTNIAFRDNTDILLVIVDIERVVSKLVVQLDPNLDFTANSGKGFNVSSTSFPITINGIDTMFILDTPRGINVPISSYFDPAGVGIYETVKNTAFQPNPTNNHLTDDIIVFPQINSTKLPYIVLSVNGFRGQSAITSNDPLYYGMRITKPTLNGLPSDITSLPANSVIIVTITAFQGSGYDKHPNPLDLGTVDAIVSVKSWESYYNSGGIME